MPSSILEFLPGFNLNTQLVLDMYTQYPAFPMKPLAHPCPCCSGGNSTEHKSPPLRAYIQLHENQNAVSSCPCPTQDQLGAPAWIPSPWRPNLTSTQSFCVDHCLRAVPIHRIFFLKVSQRCPKFHVAAVSVLFLFSGHLASF